MDLKRCPVNVVHWIQKYINLSYTGISISVKGVKFQQANTGLLEECPFPPPPPPPPQKKKKKKNKPILIVIATDILHG